MPKRVDPEERRRSIADALMRVASSRGLEAVSLRHVAEEAGATAGLVQHYFRTKDEMMLFALEVVSERAEARIGPAVAALGPDPAPRAVVRAMLLEILPLDDARRADGRVALAFTAYAAVRPSVAEAQRRGSVGLRDYVATLLPSADGATALLALVEGLGSYLLSDVVSADEAVAALDAQLERLFSASAVNSSAG
jgi:AcrR family transcriptional regulator